MRPPPESTPESDLDLVRASLRGAKDSVAELIRRLECIPRIVAALNHKVGDPFHDAELADVSQDVAILVWGRRDTFEGRARLETWVYRFCYLEYMNQFRKAKRRKSLSMEQVPELDDRLAAPAVIDATEFEGLEKALEELGPPDEEIIRLKHYEGLTFREVGERLGSSPNSVKSRYYRGLDWLRERLASEAGGSL